MPRSGWVHNTSISCWEILLKSPCMISKCKIFCGIFLHLTKVYRLHQQCGVQFSSCRTMGVWLLAMNYICPFLLPFLLHRSHTWTWQDKSWDSVLGLSLLDAKVLKLCMQIYTEIHIYYILHLLLILGLHVYVLWAF